MTINGRILREAAKKMFFNEMPLFLQLPLLNENIKLFLVEGLMAKSVLLWSCRRVFTNQRYINSTRVGTSK